MSAPVATATTVTTYIAVTASWFSTRAPRSPSSTGSVRCCWDVSKTRWSMCLPIRMEATPSPIGTETRKASPDALPVMT